MRWAGIWLALSDLVAMQFICPSLIGRKDLMTRSYRAATMPAHAAEQCSDLSVPNWTQASDIPRRLVTPHPGADKSSS